MLTYEAWTWQIALPVHELYGELFYFLFYNLDMVGHNHHTTTTTTTTTTLNPKFLGSAMNPQQIN